MKVKRGFDYLFSALLLLITSPLLLLIAFAIKIDSKGVVFFRQTRVGHQGERFLIYKFRTMYDRTPEEIDHQNEKVLSKSSDPRITRVGKILRAISLDELPQLINVIRGEMSIVGPRPIIPEQLEVIPLKYQKRLKVKPGITGLSQVKGRRNLNWEEQLIYDCFYVDSFSLLLDLKILMLTIWVVLTRKGVYGDKKKNWRAYKEKWSYEES